MDQVIKKAPEKQQILKKHVSAIHINAKLSLLQRKLVNALLYNAYENLLTSRDHSINTSLLCEMIGFDSKNIPYLKASLKGLMETVVEFDVLDDDGENVWEAMVLLPYVRIKGSVCTYSYHQALAEKLYHPDVYSKINLSVLREMNSTHALVLYENCYRYMGTSHGRTAVWDVDVFRKLMAVDGMASYKQFKVLNRNVIQPAMAEINKASNIQLELVTHRKGRAVISVQFIVRPNSQLSLLGMEQDDEVTDTRAYKALLREGISKTLARAWAIEYDEDYIFSKLQYVEEQSLKGKVKSSKTGLLKASIEQDYKSQVEVEKTKSADKERLRDEKRAREAELNELSTLFKETEAQYRQSYLKAIQGAFLALSVVDQQKAIDEFQQTLTSRLFVDDFKKNLWETRMVSQDVRDFWENRGVSLPPQDSFVPKDRFESMDAIRDRLKELEGLIG